MTERVLKCPHCNAPISPGRFARSAVCSFCGATVQVDPTAVSAARFREALQAWNQPSNHGYSAWWTLGDSHWAPGQLIARGELSNVYVAQRARWPTERVLLKVLRNRDDAPLFDHEWDILEELQRSTAAGAATFTTRLPQPVDRHGAGPLPTETELLRPVLSEHNTHNTWQGNVRYGWFDAVLARYALDVVGGVDTLALTHLDLLKQLRTWKACAGYQREPMPEDSELIAHRNEAGLVTRLAVGRTPSLDRQERLSKWLGHVTPSLEECTANDDSVLAHIERLLGRTVGLVSHGPRASDVSLRSQSRST